MAMVSNSSSLSHLRGSKAKSQEDGVTSLPSRIAAVRGAPVELETGFAGQYNTSCETAISAKKEVLDTEAKWERYEEYYISESDRHFGYQSALRAAGALHEDSFFLKQLFFSQQFKANAFPENEDGFKLRKAATWVLAELAEEVDCLKQTDIYAALQPEELINVWELEEINGCVPKTKMTMVFSSEGEFNFKKYIDDPALPNFGANDFKCNGASIDLEIVSLDKWRNLCDVKEPYIAQQMTYFLQEKYYADDIPGMVSYGPRPERVQWRVIVKGKASNTRRYLLFADTFGRTMFFVEKQRRA